MAIGVCIETPTEFARYTVSDATAIPIGTLMKLIDPHAAIAGTADADPFAGIAWEEKTASDGLTELSCAKNGVWDLEGGPAITAGALVSISGANIIKAATEAEEILGAVIGKAEETGTAEVIRVRVGRTV